MNYLDNARNLFLTAAQNLEALDASRTDLLVGVATHLPAGRRTKLKPGFNAIANSFAICITQTADVLVGSGETEPLTIQAEGCDWLTLESDIAIKPDAEFLVLEAEVFADFGQTADAFLRVFNVDGESTDLASHEWSIRGDGLSVRTIKVPTDAKSAARVRLILHVRQPISQIKLRQLGVYAL